ncbi:hypothetical protein MTP99_016607 [Tenebrio molitor]|jgi:hypothetical protein|uniref:uncharacterized protein n=1 Tax=Tenebrio molitor TaxID=7067 RepID=UPI001C398B18|nr:hypothetical protein MTP99_016607 [Tenebrio molitor]CAH1375171.1 unnamed protein product [Tenebrio molitor]
MDAAGISRWRSSVQSVMKIVLVLTFAVAALAQDSFESTGIRLALKIYDDCSKAEGFSPCLKKKAITFLDRLSRMDHFSLAEGVMVTRSNEVIPEATLSEEQLENTLPRASDAKDAALTTLLLDKVSKFVGSRTIEVTLPKLALEEGRGKKMKGMMGGMMMGMAAKMAAMVPVAIAGLFLLAGKALITAKIALLISGIIAIKKLFAAKHGGGHGGGGGGGHGWQSGGGGWQSGGGGGGGWDKRSFDDAQKLAYKAYAPK